MNAPFFKFGYFGDEVSLLIAVVIGVLFGFVLERAGFGNGRKLAAQFYFQDLAVFKVMFSAIVTAMLGIFYLSWSGLLDISLVYKGTTYLYSQLLGGAFLGVGFILGGYCPGTSIVAMATGRLDAVMFGVGVFLGIFIFGEAYPLFADFMFTGNMGVVTLPELLNISYGLVMLIVIAVAVGGFFGAEYLEKRWAEKHGGSDERQSGETVVEETIEVTIATQTTY
ncbi:MAG: YeeE/YedE thiosulfate transporter family protein [Rhodothermales bacterium]